MALSKINKLAFLELLFLLTFFNINAQTHASESALANSRPILPGAILYAMQSGSSNKAFDLYLNYYQQSGHHNLELLNQLGFLLLEQGYKSKDPEIQLLTLFGAGISTNEQALYILKDALTSNYPQLQLVSLNFLANIQNDEADQALNSAMSSNSLLIRLEALHYLTLKKHPKALGQAEALMGKVDDTLIPLFPEFFGQIGSSAAIKILKKLLNHPSENVRIEAILSTAKHDRDDLLPSLRRLVSQHCIAQQEAAATALGIMRDQASLSKLKALSQSSSLAIRLSACKALYLLGKEEAVFPIIQAAKGHEIFAISLLSTIPGHEDLLYHLSKSSNLQERVNATLALLELEDPRCLEGLNEILIQDSRDLAFLKISSSGKSLSAWKAVPSASENLKDLSSLHELSVCMREKMLNKALKLDENKFLVLANEIFEKQQNDLIPVLVELLEELNSPAAKDLLKKQQQKVGAPLIRNYCNLALYRLKEEGPYEEKLLQWLSKQKNIDIIRFRPLLPQEVLDNSPAYQLTPQETSRLLVESLEALAKSQSNKGIETLIEIIQKGNAKNQYALAGLMMRATH